jgi:hypothetical protein
MTNTQSPAFRSILHLAADSWAQLRRCDVYRVLDAAKGMGYLTDFRDVLMSERPDYATEIDACFEELAN